MNKVPSAVEKKKTLWNYGKIRKCALLGNILQKMSIDLIPKHANLKKTFLITISTLYKNGSFPLGEGSLSFGTCAQSKLLIMYNKNLFKSNISLYQNNCDSFCLQIFGVIFSCCLVRKIKDKVYKYWKHVEQAFQTATRAFIHQITGLCKPHFKMTGLEILLQ